MSGKNSIILHQSGTPKSGFSLLNILGSIGNLFNIFGKSNKYPNPKILNQKIKCYNNSKLINIIEKLRLLPIEEVIKILTNIQANEKDSKEIISNIFAHLLTKENEKDNQQAYNIYLYFKKKSQLSFDEIIANIFIELLIKPKENFHKIQIQLEIFGNEFNYNAIMNNDIKNKIYHLLQIEIDNSYEKGGEIHFPSAVFNQFQYSIDIPGFLKLSKNAGEENNGEKIQKIIGKMINSKNLFMSGIGTIEQFKRHIDLKPLIKLNKSKIEEHILNFYFLAQNDSIEICKKCLGNLVDFRSIEDFFLQEQGEKEEIKQPKETNQYYKPVSDKDLAEHNTHHPIIGDAGDQHSAPVMREESFKNDNNLPQKALKILSKILILKESQNEIIELLYPIYIIQNYERTKNILYESREEKINFRKKILNKINQDKAFGIRYKDILTNSINQYCELVNDYIYGNTKDKTKFESIKQLKNSYSLITDFFDMFLTKNGLTIHILFESINQLITEYGMELNEDTKNNIMNIVSKISSLKGKDYKELQVVDVAIFNNLQNITGEWIIYEIDGP